MAKCPQTEETITVARVKMILKMPFFGDLATRLIPVNGSGWCQTAATDGKHLYYNVDFFKELTLPQMVFVIGHEVLHCAYNHCIDYRRGARDPRLWNVALDYVINLDLVDQQVGEVLQSACLDDKFRNMTAEEVYDLIKDDKDHQHMKSMDQHLGDGQEHGEPDETGYNGPIPMSDEERKKVEQDMKYAVTEAVKTHRGSAAGCVPGGLSAMVDELTQPKLDWREVIPNKIKSLVKNDYSFARPNRKTMSMGFCLPGMITDDKVEVHVTVDASGSVDDQMVRDFFGEVLGIMEQFSDFTLHVWTFDTECYNYKTFTPSNQRDLHSYELKGRGGTDFMANWKFMRENQIQPQLLIMMTDGYPCGDWGEPDYCDVIYLIHSDTNVKAPFGMTLHYDK